MEIFENIMAELVEAYYDWFQYTIHIRVIVVILCFQLVYLGFIEVDMLDLYLNLGEMGRDYLERYFNLKTELYFTYTHLVCRTALDGM
jgi:hypothetical protein